jgi:preprotein translocase subunit SecG
MTTPRKHPAVNSPHATRGEKVQNAKGASTGSTGGHGIGEAPNSRMKKFGIWLVVFLVILFIIIDIVDKQNAKKTNSYYEPSADQILDWKV